MSVIFYEEDQKDDHASIYSNIVRNNFVDVVNLRQFKLFCQLNQEQAKSRNITQINKTRILCVRNKAVFTYSEPNYPGHCKTGIIGYKIKSTVLSYMFM